MYTRKRMDSPVVGRDEGVPAESRRVPSCTLLVFDIHPPSPGSTFWRGFPKEQYLYAPTPVWFASHISSLPGWKRQPPGRPWAFEVWAAATSLPTSECDKAHQADRCPRAQGLFRPHDHGYRQVVVLYVGRHRTARLWGGVVAQSSMATILHGRSPPPGSSRTRLNSEYIVQEGARQLHTMQSVVCIYVRYRPDLGGARAAFLCPLTSPHRRELTAQTTLVFPLCQCRLADRRGEGGAPFIWAKCDSSRWWCCDGALRYGYSGCEMQVCTTTSRIFDRSVVVSLPPSPPCQPTQDDQARAPVGIPGCLACQDSTCDQNTCRSGSTPP